MLRDADPTHAAVAQEARWLAIRFRHAACLLLTVVHLASGVPDPAVGRAVTILLAVWSASRLWGRRLGPWWTAADIAVVATYLLGTVSVAASGIGTKDLIDVKVVAATVISVGIAERVRVSAAVTVLVLLLLYYANRQTPGLTPWGFLSDLAVAYLLVEWLLAVGVRRVVLRAATVHDQTVSAAADSRVASQVAAARRRYEHEQWAVMHDTAAATLLMVGQGAAADPERIARQAARDLTVLESGIPVPGDESEADLSESLRELAAECATPVKLRIDGPLPIPRGLAWTVTAAAREALTNIDRHAHASAVVVEADAGRLVIADDGVGFDGTPGQDRHGIRHSIVERLREVGGDAEITSTPGSGTEIRLRWPVAESLAAGDDSFDETEAAAGIDRLGRSFGHGMVGIAVADTLLQSTLTTAAATPPPAVNAVLVAVTVGCALAALVPRRREPVTVALMGVAIAASLVLTAWLPVDAVLAGANWSIGASGWAVVALGFRLPPRLALSALTAWWVLVCAVILMRAPNAENLTVLGYHTAAIFFLQTFTAWFAATLDRAARQAAALHRERLRHRTADAVGRMHEQECLRRYHELVADFTPLLRGMADGTLDPGDPGVQAAARTEYARLRRLFTQQDGVGHPLLADLRTGIDAAERRGVAVSVEATPTHRELPDAVRGHLVAAARIMLDASRSRARVVVTADASGCTVSALGDCPVETLDRLSTLTDSSVHTEVVTAGELLWARLHHNFDLEGAR
ncbi:sensor histidine kinase [Nocardia sp. CDC160]|uniref:sensor histidine kinase n=1 Tax=Nocardia sp. CDC160 TaxID=3112166 RepID=UPI002DB79DDB|nr:ATP-binding protein [Nocardia sp. CDC160]MEC3915737.1 ATP-binding protein [Nocardia sp. CDC160]